MDSDKAIGGLYLDADDFLHTGFLCDCCSRLSWERRRRLPPGFFFFFFYRLTVNHRCCLYESDWLLTLSLSLSIGLHRFQFILFKSSRRTSRRSARPQHMQYTVCRHIVMTVIKQQGGKMEKAAWNCICASLKSRAAAHKHSLLKGWGEIVFLILARNSTWYYRL